MVVDPEYKFSECVAVFQVDPSVKVLTVQIRTKILSTLLTWQRLAEAPEKRFVDLTMYISRVDRIGKCYNV